VKDQEKRAGNWERKQSAPAKKTKIKAPTTEFRRRPGRREAEEVTNAKNPDPKKNVRAMNPSQQEGGPKTGAKEGKRTG